MIVGVGPTNMRSVADLLPHDDELQTSTDIVLYIVWISIGLFNLLTYLLTH